MPTIAPYQKAVFCRAMPDLRCYESGTDLSYVPSRCLTFAYKTSLKNEHFVGIHRVLCEYFHGATFGTLQNIIIRHATGIHTGAT